MGITRNQRELRFYLKLRDEGISHKKAVKMFPKDYREKAKRMKKFYR